MVEANVKPINCASPIGLQTPTFALVRVRSLADLESMWKDCRLATACPLLNDGKKTFFVNDHVVFYTE